MRLLRHQRLLGVFLSGRLVSREANLGADQHAAEGGRGQLTERTTIQVLRIHFFPLWQLVRAVPLDDAIGDGTARELTSIVVSTLGGFH